MSSHSWFAASAASRWMDCGASAVIDSSAVPEEEKPAAARGTLLHQISEEILMKELDSPAFGYLERADAAAVMEYVDFVRGIDGYHFYELHTMFIDDCGGTSDAVIIHKNGTTLEIVDAKFGRVYVDPKENKQLMLYGLGVAQEFESLYDFDEVILTIAQPACDNFTSWTISMEDLLEWGERFEEKVLAIKDGNADFNPSEEACRWCDGRTICPAYASFGQASAREQFKDVSDDSELEHEDELKAVNQLLDLDPTEWTWAQKAIVADLAISWGKMVNSTIEQMVIKNGDAVSGFKQVRGRRGNRQWDGDAGKKRLVSFLLSEGFEEDTIFADPVIISPATADSLFRGLDSGEKKERIAECTKRAQGRTIVVPVSDNRPAIDPVADARDQFGTEVDD